METAFELLDVLAFLNRRHNRRISRGTTNSLLLESFHEGRFCVARRWFCEVLLGSDWILSQRFTLFHERQTSLSFFIVVSLLVAAFLVEFQETVKLLH